ncbi:MAG: FKBP-type peptidyl-prolyl cis-trans isomerase [Prevotella sp.]|nr:FKBP-type peptidyl-prolyl cis-trans isomerase [Bacteroides sp.]MCM1366532.1 FKBP-type peptidyl-prolyl cis-trans isomerase [Prevotella sp.]
MRKILILSAIMCMVLTSCLKDDEVDYTDWSEENMSYYDGQKLLKNNDGSSVYDVVIPNWDKGCETLMQWHTPKKDNVVPMDNSTVDVIYELTTIDGKQIDSSYRNIAYGDSIYRTKPSSNIPGFWNALTHMCAGDSVTAVVPYWAGYGITGSTQIKPYSTLIFHIKLKRIVSWEVPS